MIDTAPRRAGLVLAAGALATLPANPLVRLEVVLGLSLAPLERYLGIKSVFSGMTEGIQRDDRGHVPPRPRRAGAGAGCELPAPHW